MNSYRCKLESCREKHSVDGEIIMSGIHRFCSKAHRLEFDREKVRKEKEKIKVRKVKAKTKKAFSRTKLIAEADRVFSLYIRDRDRGNNCITCKKEWDENFQCGHFMSRRHLQTRWCEDNAAGQCPKCNCWGSGEQYEFAIALNKQCEGRAELMRKLSLCTEKVSQEEILETINHYYHLLYKAGHINDFIKTKKMYL